MTDADSIWVKIDSKLKYVAPVFLLLLVVYLYSSLVSSVLSKQTLQYLRIAIVTYFVFELIAKYTIADNWRQFLRDYWFEIILLVPFFQSLKLLGAVGKTLKSVKGLNYVTYARKVVKIPKMVRKTRFLTDRPDKKTDKTE